MATEYYYFDGNKHFFIMSHEHILYSTRSSYRY